MSKEDKIRKILILIGSLMVIVGGIMILNRDNPLDKEIGYVFLTNGTQKMEVDGYKYSYNSGDKQSEIETFVSIDKAKNIPEIDYFVNDENCQIKVSYSKKDAHDISYAVYDENFDCVVDNQSALDLPGEAGKKFYVESSVNWGKGKKTVTVKYYFAINVKE